MEILVVVDIQMPREVNIPLITLNINLVRMVRTDYVRNVELVKWD